MPCLILTGHPSVGKTTLASIIKERALNHSSKRIQSVLIVNEELACPGQTKSQCYLNSHNEKKTRGALKAKFDQSVAGNKTELDQQLVILDSLNYIKGFRYELHCISKSAGQQHGIVWVLNSAQVAKDWNRKRNEEAAANGVENNKHGIYYSDRTMEELILRFEPPDERNRWDKPLYKVDMTPQEFKQQQLPGKEGEVLGKSVYNMHALSDVMGGATIEGEATTTDAPQKKKKAFKGFKRAPKTAKPVQATIVSESAKNPTPSANTFSADSDAVLYPKDFLYSSQPSEQPQEAADTSSTDHIPEMDATPEQEERNNPRRPTKSTKPVLAPPPKPDPMASIEAQVDAILDAFLLHVKPLQEGTSTRQHVAVSTNALHEMDAITSNVCNAIVQQQTQGTMVGRIPIVLTQPPTPDEEPLFLDTKQRRLPLTELKRLRRQYLRWVGTHPPEDCDTEYGIAKSFVIYIEAQL